MAWIILDAFIWWSGLAFELLLLLRAFRGRFLSQYPFFYTYAGSVFFLNLPLYFVYLGHSRSYTTWYWLVQFITLVTGYGILLELFRHVLSPCPGAERIAKIIGIGTFVAILCFVIVYPLVATTQSASGTVIEFERDLRTVQAIFLLVILSVISYYGILLGKNMKGMIIGYGLYVAASLASLAIRSHSGPILHSALDRIQPLSFNVAALIWLSTLWHYAPNPELSSRTRFEMDYESLAAKTRNMVGAMRSYLVRSARP
jgi:hypothetical protein